MHKLALSLIAVFLGLTPSLPAQIPDPLQFNGSALSSAFSGLPPVTLADQDRFSFMTALNWHTSTDYLPPFNPTEPQRAAAEAKDHRNSSDPDNVAEIRTSNPVYVGGELGFTYGRSTGKNGYEFEQGYILGEIGTDKFHLTIGMSREHVSGHGSGR